MPDKSCTINISPLFENVLQIAFLPYLQGFQPDSAVTTVQLIIFIYFSLVCAQSLELGHELGVLSALICVMTGMEQLAFKTSIHFQCYSQLGAN